MTTIEVMARLNKEFPGGSRKAITHQIKLLEILPTDEMISLKGIQDLYHEMYPNDIDPTVQFVSGNMSILWKCGLVERHPVKTGKIIHIPYDEHTWVRLHGQIQHIVTPKVKDIEEVKVYFKRV